MYLFLRLETFLVRYKRAFVAAALLSLAGGLCALFFVLYGDYKLNKGSDVVTQLQSEDLSHADRTKLEGELSRVNPALYELYKYHRAGVGILDSSSADALVLLSGSRDDFVRYMSNFHLALARGDADALSSFVTPWNGLNVEDAARFEAGFMLAKKGDFRRAKSIIDTIKTSDPDLNVSLQLLRKYIDGKLRHQERP